MESSASRGRNRKMKAATDEFAVSATGDAWQCNLENCSSYLRWFATAANRAAHTKTKGHHDAIESLRRSGVAVRPSEPNPHPDERDVLLSQISEPLPPPSAEPGDSKVIGAANYMPDLNGVLNAPAVVSSDVTIRFQGGKVFVTSNDFQMEVEFDEFVRMLMFSWNVYNSMR
jgi:hypothetical protein